MVNVAVVIRVRPERGGLRSIDRDDRMCIVQVVVNEVAFVEAQAASAMSLTGEDVEVAVGVDIEYIRAGGHHHVPRLDHHDAVRISERGGLTGADVPVVPDVVLELAAEEIPPAIAVPVLEGSQVGPA
jgi:hypothetical protein